MAQPVWWMLCSGAMEKVLSQAPAGFSILLCKLDVEYGEYGVNIIRVLPGS